jgi:hypothetical protein
MASKRAPGGAAPTAGPAIASDALSLMKAVYANAGLDPDEIPVATHWPTIPAAKAASEWEQLREWVDQLRQRFEFLDHHVIPNCWWHHNGHVEALSSLRDHELVSYADLAPASAPVDWIRALRDVAAMLRSWTSDLPCGTTHQPPLAALANPDKEAWTRHLTADIARRQPTGEINPHHDGDRSGEVVPGSA